MRHGNRSLAGTIIKGDSSRVNDLKRAESFLHEKIPLTRAMGVRVVAHEHAGFAIEAPVALNYNHLHTAFGGSISAVATLAGYTFLWLRLGEHKWHIVVRESFIRFVRPIEETIRAHCELPSAKTFAAFDKALNAGKAQLKLNVRVEENELLAAEFTGSFVARSAALSSRP